MKYIWYLMQLAVYFLNYEINIDGVKFTPLELFLVVAVCGMVARAVHDLFRDD